MSESCTVVVQNNSNVSLDAILMWHTPNEPEASDLVVENAVINAQGVAAGNSVRGTAALIWSPMDYWTCFVRYHGDGTAYVMAGTGYAPFKEFEVSDGTTITFTLAPYTSGTTDQSDGHISYSGGDSDNFQMVTPAVALVVGGLVEIGTHLVAEMVVG